MHPVTKGCLLVLIAVCWTGQVSAEVILFDEPTVQSGWYDLFIESNVEPFDHLQALMLPTDAWKQPIGFISLSPNWSQTWNDGKCLIADGNDINILLFGLGFASNKQRPFSFLFQAWDDYTVRETTQATWTGQHWEFQPATWNTPRLTPDPATLGLVTIGVIGYTTLFAARRLRRQAPPFRPQSDN